MPANSSSADTQPARDARHEVIRRLHRELGGWPNIGLKPLDVKGLDARDARLALALYTETLRRKITLETLLNTRLDRKPLVELETKMQAVLLVGACQIFFFDHLPDHAVVNESVSWARERVRPKAGGMVNAILRRMIDLRGETVEKETPVSADRLDLPLYDGRRVELTQSDVFGSDRLKVLARRTSHPVDLVSRWSARLSPAELERLLLHNLMHAPAIIANVTSNDITSNENLIAHNEPGFAVWTGDHAGLETWLMMNPETRVQDPGSATAVESTRKLDLAGQLIVDYCAGLGTKTEQLAQLHPKAKILATDIDERRFGLLSERFRSHRQVRVLPMEDVREQAMQRAALIVLDVPCSNTGVLARRVEAKYRLTPENIRSLVDVQRQIVADTLVLRHPSGGRLLYSTCSLEPEENEEMLAWIEKWHHLKATSVVRRPEGVPGGDPAQYVDGSFNALVG